MEKRMREKGIVFDFLTHYGYDEETAERVKCSGSKVWILPGDVRRMGAIRYFLAVYRLLRDNPYQIVHFHTSLQSGIGLLAANLSHIPNRICHAHSSEIQRKANPVIKMLCVPVLRNMVLNNANVLAACGREAGTFLFGKKPYHLLSNGISPVSYLPGRGQKQKAEELKDALHIPPDAVVLGQVGRLDRMKNASYSLKTAAVLAQKCKTVLIYVGDGIERDELEKDSFALCKQIPSLKVIFTGQKKREELPPFYHVFDFLLMPSKAGEGMPLTLLEAQAAGCHVLASEQIPPEGNIGLGLVRFLPLGNPVLWADEILYRKDFPRPDVQQIMGAFQKSGYCEDSAFQKWLNLYS